MANLRGISAFLFSLSTAFTAAYAANELNVVSTVDLDRYAGRWYEIARYPTPYQTDCVSSMADYKRLGPNQISVLNTCVRAEGPVRTIEGKATVVSPSGAGKLKVEFSPTQTGDYWIIELDPGYRYAVVSGPNRDTLFIIARSAPMDPALLDSIKQRLSEKGFDVEKLIYDRY